MNNEDKDLQQLKALAKALDGWHWPDRKRDADTGVHYFGQWKEGEFYELGTIEGSTYTLDYADDIRLLKFIRAMQPSTILALIARIESLAADAERMNKLEEIMARTDSGAHIFSHGKEYKGETMREVLDLVIAKEKA